MFICGSITSEETLKNLLVLQFIQPAGSSTEAAAVCRARSSASEEEGRDT